MNLNKSTLIEFEQERLQHSFIPPEKSNSFYNIGDGQINIFCISSNPRMMDLSTYGGEIHIGTGTFTIDDPYISFTNSNDSTLIIDGIMCIKHDASLHGTIYLKEGSSLVIANNSTVTMYSDTKFIIEERSQIIIENNSLFKMMGGELDIHLAMIDGVLYNNGIYIDSSVVVNIGHIDLGDRPYSMTDYESSLRNKTINIRTQGEYNSSVGRVGYSWTGGSPLNNSQCIRLSLIWGEIVLGDFKLSVLGKQNNPIKNLQVVSDLMIMQDATLYISNSYMDCTYLRPELYLGIIAGNNKEPANCEVNGNIIASGDTAYITLDRGATLHINDGGSIALRNNAIMRSTNNRESDQILFIDGTLIIDDISQLSGFSSDNIVFGNTGKIIILNPDNGEHRVLLSIPMGIHNSELYRLFENVIDHIEYHISNNTGIAIDKYYEYFNRDMTDWFGGRRIEKAIHDGILIWHDGGFIELNNEIIPWVNENCSLLQASRLFKSYGSYDSDKLEEVAARLKYAGSGAITFRFIYGNSYHDVILSLGSAIMKTAVANNIASGYTIDIENSGELFLRNGIASATNDDIINQDARVIHVEDGENNFILS